MSCFNILINRASKNIAPKKLLISVMVYVDEGNKGNLKLHIQHIEFFYQISLTFFNFSFCENYNINFENLQKNRTCLSRFY